MEQVPQRPDGRPDGADHRAAGTFTASGSKALERVCRETPNRAAMSATVCLPSAYSWQA